MKKIVPFTKEIKFDNNIYEINSISLEHTLSLGEDNMITGKFIISGSYKVTEASINIDEFNYNLPFSISIDKKYDTKDVTVDINDFYYEVIDNKILSVNIEISIDNLEEREMMEMEMLDDIKKEKKLSKIDQETVENNCHDLREDAEEKIEKDKEQEKISNDENRDEIVYSIFDDLDDNENFVTYKVHIVTENDTVEAILQKYEISSNKLEAYNDLSDLKIGDKLIIPTND